MRKLARSYRRLTDVRQSARHNMGNYALHTELHGRQFKKAVENLQKAIAESDQTAINEQQQLQNNHAYWLHYWSKQAISAANLILNDGKPVRLVWEELEREARNAD